QAKGKMSVVGEREKTSPQPKLLLTSRIVLNEGRASEDIPIKDIAMKLKDSMNILRGAFFDTKRGRVAYEQMQRSEAYTQYVELSHSLKKMELDELERKEERLAFWINLYNVIVIHGVIELGIRDSVKEVRNFFKRVQYQIGDLSFTPDAIEHGILRGNRRPPNSLFRVFQGNDPRLKFAIKSVDPRIHFTLVCASSSCPPIEVYTPEKLGKELTIAGETFLNGGGIIIDGEKNRVSLSRIFSWYAADFGKTLPERLRFIAPYLYNRDDREFLEEKAEGIKVEYQDYDWRLNRY
ncbi:MAG: DUF547 domain-containing protein, partial [Thermodesulfobacteriota bacterium]